MEKNALQLSKYLGLTATILDTNSQIKTKAQSFYNNYLSGQPICPLDQLLDVEGANGLLVPCLGYLEVCTKFPKDFLYSEPEIPTIALVVPDVNSNSEIHLLIGTTTLDAMYEQCSNQPTFQGSPSVMVTIKSGEY